MSVAEDLEEEEGLEGGLREELEARLDELEFRLDAVGELVIDTKETLKHLSLQHAEMTRLLMRLVKSRDQHGVA